MLIFGGVELKIASLESEKPTKIRNGGGFGSRYLDFFLPASVIYIETIADLFRWWLFQKDMFILSLTFLEDFNFV